MNEEDRGLPVAMRCTEITEADLEALCRLARDPEYMARVQAMLDRIKSKPPMKRYEKREDA